MAIQDLSKREREVAMLIAAGYDNKTMAHLLCVSDKTVMTHRKTIKRKTGTSNAVTLAKVLVREGGLDPKAWAESNPMYQNCA